MEPEILIEVNVLSIQSHISLPFKLFPIQWRIRTERRNKVKEEGTTVQNKTLIAQENTDGEKEKNVTGTKKNEKEFFAMGKKLQPTKITKIRENVLFFFPTLISSFFVRTFSFCRMRNLP